MQKLSGVRDGRSRSDSSSGSEDSAIDMKDHTDDSFSYQPVAASSHQEDSPPHDCRNCSDGGTLFTRLLQENNLVLNHSYNVHLRAYHLLANSFMGACFLALYVKELQQGVLRDCIPTVFCEKKIDEDDSEDDDSMDQRDLIHNQKEKKCFSAHKVANILFDALFDLKFKKGDSIHVSREEFEDLAQQLHQLFPAVGPATMWYTRSVCSGQNIISARGILYNKYKGCLRLLISVGFIDKRRVLSESVASIEEVLKILNEESSINDNFKSTWSENKRFLQQFFSKNEMESIYSRIPLLQTKEGLEMLVDEFDQKFKECKEIFIQNWPKQAKLILMLLQENRTPKDVYCNFQKMYNEYVQKTGEKDDPVAEQILGLLVMPRMLGAQTCRVVSKNLNAMEEDKPNCTSWKASSQEVLDSFIYHSITNTLEEDWDADLADAWIEKLHCKYQQHELPLPLHMIMFGPINNIEKTIIVMGKQKIEFFGRESPLHAVDACFKATTILEQRFPVAATRPWEFLQRRIYQMPIKTMSKSVTNLCANLDIVCGNLKTAYP